MRISNTYPENAVKLYHIKPGQAFRFTPNDGTIDNDIYIMTDLGINGSRTLIDLGGGLGLGVAATRAVVVSLSTGAAKKIHRSSRGVVENFCISLEDKGEVERAETDSHGTLDFYQWWSDTLKRHPKLFSASTVQDIAKAAWLASRGNKP